MNYLNQYKKLIIRSCNRKLLGKSIHNHHVIPESIEKEIDHVKILYFNEVPDIKIGSTVKLTFREHYIAHLLLPKIFKQINTNCYEKMVYAYNVMSNSRKINNRQYSFYREDFSKIMSKRMIGENHWNYGGHMSEQNKEKLRLSQIGRQKSPEEINKINATKIKNGTTTKGRIKTQDEIDRTNLTKIKNGTTTKGRVKSKEEIEKQRRSRMTNHAKKKSESPDGKVHHGKQKNPSKSRKPKSKESIERGWRVRRIISSIRDQNFHSLFICQFHFGIL